MNGRLAPEKTQHRIALFDESTESLPIAARVFARNQPDVTGQGFPVDKSRGIAEEHFGGQRRHRAHAWMRHEAAGLRTLARLLTDLLVAFIDMLRQVIVERV